jgi:magnesium transporter
MESDRMIAEKFIKEYPLQAAQVLEGLSDEEVAAFFQETPLELAVPLLNHMNAYRAAKCFTLLSSEFVTGVLENCNFTKVESLLRQFDEPFRNTALQKLSPQLSSSLMAKLEQSAHSVGALMIPLTLSINKEMTVKEVLRLVRKNHDVVDTSLYVVDVNGQFEGVIKLTDLFFADKSQSISLLMTTEIPKFYPDEPIYNILDHPAWEQYQSIPVVERSERLIGILPFEIIRKGLPEKGAHFAKQIMETSTALGELYRIGLTGFLQSVGK